MPSGSSERGPEGHHDLEHRVRRLLSADSSRPLSTTPQVSSSVGGASATGQRLAVAKSESPHGPGLASPRNSRRRPNQAQRRQMSAQFSLPIGTHTSLAPRPAHFSASSTSRLLDNSLDSVHGGLGTLRYQDPTLSTTPQHRHLAPSGPSTPRAPEEASSTHLSPGSQQSYPHFYERKPHNSVGPAHLSRSEEESTEERVYMPRQLPATQNGKDAMLARQSRLLDELCPRALSDAGISRCDIAEKEAFRLNIEAICQEVISKYEHSRNNTSNFPVDSVQLRCFGSLSSGFATKSSDMDLGLLSPMSLFPPDMPGSPIPRLLEKALLDVGLGARLLTRTRVPIIKLCENPPPELLRELRIEQQKWEGALGTDVPQPPDTDAGNNEIDMHGRGSLQRTPLHPSIPVLLSPSIVGRQGQPTTRLGSNAEDSLSDHWSSLHQAETQTLSSYYGSAKRALRKSGGYDLSISNFKTMTKENCEKLLIARHLFVAGLHDQTLRSRLSGDAVLEPPAPDLRNLRTLQGIYICAEGEALLMKWERRDVMEESDIGEQNLNRAVDSWRTIRKKVAFGIDSVYHAKDLQSSLERIKQFASIQLIGLEQGQYESTRQYADRTGKLLADLLPRAADSATSVERQVMEKYIQGIHNHDIRKDVAKFMVDAGPQSRLQGVFVRHKTLQLAQDFERAVAKNLYPDSLRETLNRYISLLRGPLEPARPKCFGKQWVLPIPASSAHILTTIRQLPDPATLAPNRPRDAFSDRLEFPKSGVGVQCDINFSAHLALQNTLLLRCYSHSDPRVRPMVLFIKHWAKLRAINSPYRGTLSSYGFVLMALHFLINIAQPFVCPNLQKLGPVSISQQSSDQATQNNYCMGRDVRFWRDEEEIMRLAQANELTRNGETVGQLLRGFFEYYAQGAAPSFPLKKGFDWGREVISIRTVGGILAKQDKGWTSAKTVTIVDQPPTEPPAPTQRGQKTDETSSPSESFPKSMDHKPQRGGEIKEIKHRYLFAIEDPFEIDHNVARTVTHNGIVSIRNEFRRAWRIIQNAGHGRPDEGFLEVVDLLAKQNSQDAYFRLLTEIH